MVLTVVFAILILGVLVFVHELGHFLAAKQFGIGVEKFSLGFGPKIVSKQVGETEYLLSWIPLGGYVKLMGQEVSDFPVLKDPDRASDPSLPIEPMAPPEKSFALRPVGQRMWVVLAGPVFNLLFAVLVFWAVGLGGTPHIAPSIAKVVPESPAEKAGMREGDEVVAIDGRPIRRWDELVQAVLDSQGKSMEFEILRGRELLSVKIQPEVMTTRNLVGEEIKRTMIGVQTEGVLRLAVPSNGEPPDPITTAGRAFQQIGGIVVQTAQAVSLIFSGAVPAKEALGGPIMIGERAGWHCQAGAVNCSFFAAFLSVNLAILNLLPIPVLDGGHVFFYLIEWVQRKPMSFRTREIAQQVGFFVIILLMIFAFYSDIMRFLAPN